MAETTSGGKALAEALIRMGAERVYGIIGTSNLGFVDALYEVQDRLRYISCRHEQVAASMADAEGRLTGRPGVVLVHSGPGALNAMISAGNAGKDCSPFIIIAGAVKRRLAQSDGMLELEHVRLFAPLCRGAFRVERAAQVPDVFARAYRAAMSGARGPVLIEVPEDVWAETAEVDLDAMVLEAEAPAPALEEDVASAVSMLSGARLPLILAGGGVAYAGASGLLREFAERMELPVATTGNGRGVLPETHRLCLGRAGFGGGSLVADKALERGDALLCLGCGISDMTTYEYTLPLGMKDITVVDISGWQAPQAPPAKIMACDAGEFLKKALEAAVQAGPRADWDEELADARETWDAMLAASLARKGELPAGGQVARALAERLSDDSIVCVGAGTHLLYAMDFIPCVRPLTFMSTVNFGSMGFGMAASMAAKAVYPERVSIALLGDGDFAMTMQDIETAVRERLGIKVFIMNDSMYRVLNIRQKLSFQGRIYGTEHGNPDFAALARSFGAVGIRLDRCEAVDEAVGRAMEEEGPVVVDVIIDPDDLPPLNLEANLRMSIA